MPCSAIEIIDWSEAGSHEKGKPQRILPFLATDGAKTMSIC